jgi:hypothetical protein
MSFVVPPKLITLRAANIPNSYYTSVVENKQCIFGFMNNESAKKCAYFLSDFKHKYGDWPKIDSEDDPKVELALIQPHKRVAREFIFNNEIIMDEHETSRLLNSCSLTNINLLSIYDFQYSMKNSRIVLSISGAQLQEENPPTDQDMYVPRVSLLNVLVKLDM